MATFAWMMTLADVPAGDLYIHPAKLLTILVGFALWTLFAQWVDKDTVAVNTFRTVWNMVTIVSGAIAMLLLLFLPSFWLALAAFLVINVVSGAFYVFHRNARVVDEDRAFTPAHVRRLLSGNKSASEKRLEVKERVRLVASDGRHLGIPEENDQRELFALTQDLMFDVLLRRAERVSVVPAGQVAKVQVSIDGIAGEREPLERGIGDALTAYFKEAAGLNLEERRKPQKGKMSASVADSNYDLVVRTSGSTAGESMTLRIVGDEKNLKIADIGFTAQQLEAVKELVYADKGLLVLTAPPRGGLTTSAYSFSRSHDAFLQNIQTLEIERKMEIENITQNVYVPREDHAFSDELQRLVRTDPDVIVIPKIPDRDLDSAVFASKAAVKKQNVYVALPALDLWDGLRRWASLVGDAKLLSRSVFAITHQRLVRKLCENCKAPYKPDPATLKKLNLPSDKVLYRPPEPEYDKHGNPILCNNCQGSGYVGRTAVFNLLVLDDELREVIANGGSLADVRGAAIKKGGLGLQQTALQKVLDGVTSIEEVVRATKSRAKKPKGGAKPAAKKPVPAQK